MWSKTFQGRMTAKMIQAAYGIHLRNLVNARNRGQIASEKLPVGDTVIYKIEDVEDYLRGWRPLIIGETRTEIGAKGKRKSVETPSTLPISSTPACVVCKESGSRLRMGRCDVCWPILIETGQDRKLDNACSECGNTSPRLRRGLCYPCYQRYLKSRPEGDGDHQDGVAPARRSKARAALAATQVLVNGGVLAP